MVETQEGVVNIWDFLRSFGKMGISARHSTQVMQALCLKTRSCLLLSFSHVLICKCLIDFGRRKVVGSMEIP